MGYDQATREMAVRLYLEGNSFRGIGKVLSVHYVSVINWVNAHERTLPQQVADKTPTDSVLFSLIIASRIISVFSFNRPFSLTVPLAVGEFRIGGQRHHFGGTEIC